MPRNGPLPLDYGVSDYAYIERPNTALLALLLRHLGSKREPRVLDVGCGAGANARALRAARPGAHIVGVEPNARAARLASESCDRVLCGSAEDWASDPGAEPFDAVLLSDVVEHVVNPVEFLQRLSAAPPLSRAVWLISVPNYAVWYNRARTLLGRFDYAYSGLYDRTHLRFFTRRSIQRLLEHVGFFLLGDTCSPSLVQSLAPLLRRWFDADVEAGDHLTLAQSPAYSIYERCVEPLEARVCRAWPELLGFQIVTAARLSTEVS